MTRPDRAIELLTDFLEDAPDRAPDPLLEIVLADLRTAPQRGGWRLALRRLPMLGSTAVRYSAVAGVVVIASVIAFGLWTGRVNPIGAPGNTLSPPPTALATPTRTPATSPTPTGTPAWETYTSSEYGILIGHPADWSVNPAQRAWDMDTDAPDWLSPAMEDFTAPAGDVRVSVWSVPFEFEAEFAGTTEVEAWIDEYCLKTDSVPCTGIHERAVPMCLERRDCHPGLLVPFNEEVKAFFTNGAPGSDMTVAVVWRPELDASVLPYGGARRLLESFLATMCVWPADALPPFDGGC